MSYLSVCKEESKIYIFVMQSLFLTWQIKNRMRQLRTNGWEQFLERVTLFCNKRCVQITAMKNNYVPYGKSAHYAATKEMMITSKEKYILMSLIKLVKSLIIDLL